MDTRMASIGDAAALTRVLRDIIDHTGRERPSDDAFVIRQYLANPASIRCTVALDAAGEIIGFQSLIRAKAGNRYDVPEGWGIIGTHISPRAHRQGGGSALFRSSREAAEQAGLERIDACIATGNASGLRYYEAMGFRTYRESTGIVQKLYGVRPVRLIHLCQAAMMSDHSPACRVGTAANGLSTTG